jgi:hypothetical protein
MHSSGRGERVTTFITLEVPEDVAQRLTADRARVPEMLRWALRQFPPATLPHPGRVAVPALAFTEMIEFLSSHPSAEQITAFKISDTAQARLAELLEKNREEGLNEAENAELDWYERVYEIMTRLKAQTRLEAR